MVVFHGDPCGIICLIIVYTAVFYADYVVVRHIVMPTMSDSLLGAGNVIIFNIIIFFIIISHIRSVFSDPGTVPIPKTGIDFSDHHAGQRLTRDNGWTVCMKCETYRPPRAHHCRVCRRCIKRMDHHCPWINNCVGELNQKFFIQFLFYVGIACFYSVSLVVASWMIGPVDKLAEAGLHQTRIIHSSILVIECILFGLFVVAIGCDQLQAILNDETAVEYVKRQGKHHRGYVNKWSLLAEVFGDGSPMLWLCPFTASSSSSSPSTVEEFII
ncbi:hypothetical protein HELRODRAFT_112561 [Helobdella robusta]|uniref:Palmitoyltransferase n=1 Tax=Helobdella robusta TaxID=6412 RepID=T1EFK7_HELRO|nr:hypothetical protein HELRODRAFT_112561 [Helobdella robusta]ESO01571.1 hypothetical protein HELRODRAFT_112561 [Helobdella robusta]